MEENEENEEAYERLLHMLCPERDKIIDNDGILEAKILDGQLDIIECTFMEDMCVLDSSGYTTIDLTIENLKTLIII